MKKIVDYFKLYRRRIFIKIIQSILIRLGLNYQKFYLLKINILDIDLNSKLNLYNYDNVVEINENHIKSLDFVSDKKKQLLIKRLKSKKYICLGVKKNLDVIYLTWICLETINYPLKIENKIKLNSNQAFFEDSICHPRYRGQGLHSKMNIFRVDFCKKIKKSEAFVLVSNLNIPALKVQIKTGFKIIEHLTIIKLFYKSFIFKKQI